VDISFQTPTTVNLLADVRRRISPNIGPSRPDPYINEVLARNLGIELPLCSARSLHSFKHSIGCVYDVSSQFHCDYSPFSVDANVLSKAVL